jgi:hypothetical protein
VPGLRFSAGPGRGSIAATGSPAGTLQAAMSDSIPREWPRAIGWPDGLAPVTTAEIEAFTDEAGARARGSLATAGYYLRRWQPLLAGDGRSAGFNGAFFLVGWLWCLYRRLYGPAIIIVVLELLAQAVAFAAFGLGDVASALAGALLIRGTVAWQVNRWYWERAVRVIAASRSGPSAAGSGLDRIAAAGGFSPLALAVGLAIQVGVNLLGMALAPPPA